MRDTPEPSEVTFPDCEPKLVFAGLDGELPPELDAVGNDSADDGPSKEDGARTNCVAALP